MYNIGSGSVGMCWGLSVFSLVKWKFLHLTSWCLSIWIFSDFFFHSSVRRFKISGYFLVIKLFLSFERFCLLWTSVGLERLIHLIVCKFWPFLTFSGFSDFSGFSSFSGLSNFLDYKIFDIFWTIFPTLNQGAIASDRV